MRRLLALAASCQIVIAALIGCGGDDTTVTPAEDAAAEAHYVDAAQEDAVPPPSILDASTEASFNLWPASEGPLVYWGGPVLLGTPNVYYIWYGNWKGSNTPAILEDLVKGFSETGYSNILTAYYQTPQPLYAPPDAGDAGIDASVDANVPDGPREYLSGRVSFARSIYVGYPRGPALKTGDVRGIVTDLLHANDLPYDPNGVYFVLTSGDVTETDSDGWANFCSDYCGYHNGRMIDNVPVHYAFVGDPAGCLDGCTMQPTFVEAGIAKSPNDNWSADGMASVIVHELCESITDPMPDTASWQDQWMSNENGDMCAWRFDPTYPTLDGSRANVRFGQRDFLVQQMWVLEDAGFCALQP